MALRPRRVARPGRARAPLVGLAAAAPVAIAALGLCVAFGAPWLAERYQQRAASEWRASSVSAYRDLDRAASLNPLSADPKLMAGAIALRLHDRGTARRAFSQALGRNGSDPYPLLELGMIEADAGRRPQARALLARAVRANPRDDLTRSVRARVARGESVNIASVNRTILVRSQKRLNPR
jgi:tetratricopeptide (TPR) repeat protein